MEYVPFITAFENTIESNTTSSSESLHYLEQFLGGKVKDLKSCQNLPPDKGYEEMRQLMKKKFGDNYHIVATYEKKKSLNWSEMKAEDTTTLNKFSIFLMRYKNAMEGNKYLTKHDQPDTIRKLMKSPSSLNKNLAPFG